LTVPRDVVVDRLEKVIKLARQEMTREFLICLPDHVLETQNIKHSHPSVFLIPFNHSTTIINPIS
jgi:hypothetical protein